MIRNIKLQYSVTGGSIRLVEYEFGDNQYFQIEYWLNKQLAYALKFTEESIARAYYDSKIELLDDILEMYLEEMIQKEIQTWKTR